MDEVLALQVGHARRDLRRHVDQLGQTQRSTLPSQRRTRREHEENTTGTLTLEGTISSGGKGGRNSISSNRNLVVQVVKQTAVLHELGDNVERHLVSADGKELHKSIHLFLEQASQPGD